MVRQRPLPFPEPPSGEAEAAALRSQRFHIACKDAGLTDDEQVKELILFHTFGDTDSARKMTEQQYLSLLKIVNNYRRGKVDIRYDKDGKLYLEGMGIPVKR